MEILITGAIGDFIAVESFIPENQLKKIKKVYLATPRHKDLIYLFKLLPYWKNMHVEILWDDWSEKIPYIETKEHLGNLLQEKPNNWNEIIDLSIFTIFNDATLPKFRKSSFIKNTLCEIKQKLPDNYIVIAPSTVTRGQNGRKDIDATEWQNIKMYLSQTDQQAVVLGVYEENYQVINHPRIINLMGVTTLEESIEIIKKASGYIGIDSFLSVLACQLFEKERIIVKSLSPHLMFSKKYYYPTQKEFDFIVNTIIAYRHDNIISAKPAIFFNQDFAHSFSNDVLFQINLDNLIPYEFDYFQNFVNLKNTNISKKLNKFRVSLTKKYSKNGKILDIGIGSGEFVENIKKNIFGFDINPYGISWLKNKNIYLNPYYQDISKISVVTMWDAIEHMTNPCYFLSLLKKNQHVIITMPIYDNFTKINLSKHFKKNEHLYYWTNQSFEWYMNQNGFKLIEISDEENKCGRQGVRTFVFKKFKENIVFAFGQNINKCVF